MKNGTARLPDYRRSDTFDLHVQIHEVGGILLTSHTCKQEVVQTDHYHVQSSTVFTGYPISPTHPRKSHYQHSIMSVKMCSNRYEIQQNPCYANSQHQEPTTLRLDKNNEAKNWMPMKNSSPRPPCPAQSIVCARST